MRTLSQFVTAYVLSAVCLAQATAPATPIDKAPAASVSQSLRATATAGPTAFEVRWQPPASTAAIAGRVAKPGVEQARGAYAANLLWLETQGTEPKTWVQAGRHTVTRDKGQAGWRLAGARARTAFLPDPVLMLHLLAANLPEVAARSIAESDGAPSNGSASACRRRSSRHSSTPGRSWIRTRYWLRCGRWRRPDG